MSDELQTLALKIMRHKCPEILVLLLENQEFSEIRGEQEAADFLYELWYDAWQEIAPKYVEKRAAHHLNFGSLRYTEIRAKADAYEASLTPLGIAKAYCEVYGLED